MTMQEKKRILSGMRPSGKLHLGHLKGALENWIRLTESYDCYFFSADWHALTSEYADTSEITPNTFDMAIDWIAAGLDPGKCTFFIQSKIKQHAELFLLLAMITPLPWALKCPTFKEQQEQLSDRDLNTYGFLGYPVLQAADILIYLPYGVPVGQDQLPHIELTRMIARRFNNFFGAIFPEPEALLTPAAKVPGTDGRKMSKSYGNAILLSDSADTVKTKINTMVTDPARKRRSDPGNPDICPVFELHKIFTTPDIHNWVVDGCRTAGIGCLDCKKPLIEAIQVVLDPVRKKRDELEADPDYVRNVLENGSAKAMDLAEKTMQHIRKSIGIF